MPRLTNEDGSCHG